MYELPQLQKSVRAHLVRARTSSRFKSCKMVGEHRTRTKPPEKCLVKSVPNHILVDTSRVGAPNSGREKWIWDWGGELWRVRPTKKTKKNFIFIGIEFFLFAAGSPDREKSKSEVLAGLSKYSVWRSSAKNLRGLGASSCKELDDFRTCRRVLTSDFTRPVDL